MRRSLLRFTRKKTIDKIEFMRENTVVNVLFNGCLSNEWAVGHGARQGTILSGLILIFLY